MNKYNHKEIEKKWQEKWEKTGAAVIDKDDKSKEKFYILDMFPYPSGTGLHMGHTETYSASDTYYRFKKMQEYDVLHPQGFDSFGLPTENFAIKTGIHPAETTRKNIENYIRQMKSLGFAYDFDEQAVTSDAGYYKWTQWIFGKFFENGLAYKKTQKANWCPFCQTVIANEQMVDGKCERCGTQIEQKEIPGWFFKITDFAEELIDDLDKVDWPEHTKKNQKNWIGKSEGILVKFQITNDNSQTNSKSQNPGEQNFIEVFTTRVDTIFGCTYVVVAPEHPIIIKTLKQENIKTNLIGNIDEIREYVEMAKNKTELDRMEAKEKTGVKLEGVMAINPFNGEELPVFVADYVLGSYGTGAVMAVPAHDERDFEFAKKKGLEIKAVILPYSGSTTVGNDGEQIKKEEIDKILNKKPFVDDGYLISSENYSGSKSKEAREKMTAWLEENNLGERKINYRLRDWSISRQRYWGCPIPIVYSPEGEAKFVGEENLPWTLPEDVDFVPSGVSPLSKSEELKKRVEKIFGKGWTTEYDTMDTFVDSSWYFLRYPDANNEKEFCSAERMKRWLPVDLYIGGAEHTYMHLLFARFFTKAMHKIGILNFDEPFLKLRHQGMVLDKFGKKMSKSKGNVVNPDDMVEKFGADSVRMYMLFAAPLEDEVMWNEENIVGTYRFLEKVLKLQDRIKNQESEIKNRKIETLIHKTIKKVTEDIENLKYNTAISALMILVNAMEKQKEVLVTDYELLVIILSPFAPHIAEELWEKLEHKKSIFEEKWPECDESVMSEEEIEMAVQINGRVRDRIFVAADVTEDEVKETALESEKIKAYIAGKEIKKVIFVPRKILNIVIG